MSRAAAGRSQQRLDHRGALVALPHREELACEAFARLLGVDVPPVVIASSGSSGRPSVARKSFRLFPKQW
jgi:hypothetical protein